ncbi:hypothetical protein Asppvi_006370 [Aspergillus pseudoviridinutans]|uniref:Uncharacterized protein n=1 Tax=Aspergillus pseudoviridinutans TaxID=1517512 RepID=A0A9P3BGK2_9EURO|nr:uncharacterized protein Asppvi_006370 [Aspergillus pseudoviridinutans]GIJ87464.1 hypothetical protein Asppvi_006370 [Aspergillus pseudoviridinutans]
MDLTRKVWIQEGPYFMKHYSHALSSYKDSMKTDFWHAIESTPFRLLDLPFEIRSEIFCRAISSTDNYWLDREVIIFGESLKSTYYIRGRTVWRGSNGVYMNLLTTSQQICDEVQQALFSRFAFDALGWGYTLRYSDPSKTPNHLPKHRIMHIAYTPYFTEYMREHRQSVDLILSGLPLLMAVARLFRQVGKVAVVGQSLMGELQQQLVMEARKELEDEPWYWELDLDYLFSCLFSPVLLKSISKPGRVIS